MSWCQSPRLLSSPCLVIVGQVASYAGVRPMTCSSSLASVRNLFKDNRKYAFGFLPGDRCGPKSSSNVIGISRWTAGVGTGNSCYRLSEIFISKTLKSNNQDKRKQHTSWWRRIAAPAGFLWKTSIMPVTLPFEVFVHFRRMTYLTSTPPENHKVLSDCRCGQLSDQPLSTITRGKSPLVSGWR